MRKVKVDDGQLEFDFMQEYRENIPIPPYIENPECDNDRLLNLQYEFRKNKDYNALTKMYQTILPIAGRILTERKRVSKKTQKLRADELKEKAHNVASYIVESFLLDEEYFVRKTFMSVIYLRVIHELFYASEATRNVDFVDDETLEIIGREFEVENS